MSVIICAVVIGVTSALIAVSPHPLPATGRSPVNVPEAEHSQIAAATSNAFVALRRDIELHAIAPGLTVEDFIHQTDSRDQMNAALHRAEQIGGPRWVDDYTCQIQLEISGARVVQALTEIAAADPKRSPMPADQIDSRLRTWKDRTFAATGSSIRADMVKQVRPMGVDAWRNVDDAARIATIEAARENAVHRVLDELRPVKLDDQTTLGSVLQSNPTLVASLSDWLRQRPVTALEFQDDLQVRYTLALSRHQLFDQFVQSAQQAGVKLPPDDALAIVRNRFKQEIANTTGVAPAPANRVVNPPHDDAQALIPAQPPEWIFDQIDATATAAFHSSPLRTKREAEDRATESIRAKLLAMQLSKDVTIDAAGKRSPIIRDAVGRAVSRVRLYQVDYAADGAVTVKMMLDPREFWYDLSKP